MAKSPPPDFGKELLRQDEPLHESEYKEYRMKLENSLNRAERNEKLVGWIAGACFAVAVALMFVGGSRVLGSFDPWDRDATIISVTFGVIYCVASVVFWFALASYFSRFRPRTREAKDCIRDARMLELEREIHELRREIRGTSKQE
jgi:hypothetical protein